MSNGVDDHPSRKRSRVLPAKQSASLKVNPAAKANAAVSPGGVTEDDWDDDFLFTQPELLEIVDAGVEEAMQKPHPKRRPAARELCRMDRNGFKPQLTSGLVPSHYEACSSTVAEELLSSQQLTVDRLSQDCDRYKGAVEELKRTIRNKEGEIRILREWKLAAEREELRKQSQLYAKQQSESMKLQQLEQQHAIQLEALKTQLKFTEQEKYSLEEKLQEERRLRRSLECQLAPSATGGAISFPDRKSFYGDSAVGTLCSTDVSMERGWTTPNKLPRRCDLCSVSVQTEKFDLRASRKENLHSRLQYEKHITNIPEELLKAQLNSQTPFSGAIVNPRLLKAPFNRSYM